MSKQSVGRSWRTYAKHELVNSMIGQEVGVVRQLSDVQRHVWIDLTAGDAAVVDGGEWCRSCSPGILAMHAVHAHRPTEIRLCEIQPATFSRLLSNLAEHLPHLGYEKDGEGVWTYGDHVKLVAENISGREVDVSVVRRSDAVFVLNDPNAITDWAMRPSFAREICNRTGLYRSVSTMGCNAAGIKRLDLAERRQWFELLEAQQVALPKYRDLLLAAIEKDEAQWAYLVCTAAKWRDTSEKVVQTAFRTAIQRMPEESRGRTAAVQWLGMDPLGFEETKRQLFLTVAERTRDETPLLFCE